MFAKSGVIIETISEQIASAGEKALIHLYKGTDDHNLDSLRYRSSPANICSCNISLVSGISPS